MDLVLCGLLFCAFGLGSSNQEKGRSLGESDSFRLDLKTTPPSDGRLNLQLLTNPDTNLIATLNATASIAIVFDINLALAGVFHGATGEVIILNLENQVCIHCSAGSDGWVARSKSFLDYFKGLRSLKPLYECGLKNGEKFGLAKVSDKVNTLLQWGVTSVSRGEFSVTRTKALIPQFFMSKAGLGALRGPLKGILNILGTRVTTIGINHRAYVVRLKTLGEIVSKAKCGPNILANVNWNVIFNEPSPIKLLIYIFSVLNEQKVDLRPIIRDYADNFARFLAALGGNSTRGINGVLRVVGAIRAINTGKSSINELVPVAAEYFRNSGDNPSNFQDLQTEFQELLIFIQKMGLSSEMKAEAGFYRGVVQNSYQDCGIDWIQVIRLCYNTRDEPLHSLVNILSAIRRAVRIETSIGVLLYYLAQLTVDFSIGDITALIPRLKIDGSVDIRFLIFRGAKLSSLLKNVYKFLRGRPIFNLILSIIDKSLVQSGCVTLKEIFQSPHFLPTRRAITKILAKIILNVNGKRVNNNTVVLTEHNKHHKRIHHGIGRNRQLSSLEKHVHVRHHNEENHHVHKKHHERHHIEHKLGHGGKHTW